VLVVTGSTSAQAAVTVPTCPSTSLTRTGTQSSALSGALDKRTWDLNGATWSGSSRYADVSADPTTAGCIDGGSTDGGIAATATRDCWYDGAGCTAAGKGDGFTMNLADAASNWGVIRDTYTEDYEDAYDVQTDVTSGDASAYLDHVEAKRIRDDCIENEGSSSDPDVPVDNLHVKNSLFDGCFTGIAWRPPGATSSSVGLDTTSKLVIEDSLIHISNQPLGSGYCDSSDVTSGRCLDDPQSDNYLGNYGLWKWSEAAPAEGNVTMSNTIVKLDGQSYSSCKPFDWPGGKYTNVTLVWDSPTSYKSICSGTAYTLPTGVTFTTDTSVWTDAVASWRGGSSSNAAPRVSAGSDSSVTMPSSATLRGTVADDGLPSGSTVTHRWSKVSGPGTVTFADPAALDTTAAFSTSGTYVLRLTATDGSLSDTDDVQVTVAPAPASAPAPTTTNTAPSVSAGIDTKITLPADADLDGRVTDDGLPSASSVTQVWTKTSGPGTVTFGDTNAVDTTARFSAAGTYVLTLTATDGALTASDDVEVTVSAVPALSGIAFVGSGFSYDVDNSVARAVPADAAVGDVVIFRAMHNQGSGATLNLPSGLTALGAQVNDGSSLASRFYYCTMPCSAASYTFTASSTAVYEISVSAVAYRGANAPTMVAHVADGNTDNLHPATGTFSADGWRLVFGGDRKYVSGGSNTPIATWTGGLPNERLDAGGRSANGSSTQSQVVADSGANVSGGSATIAATGSHPTPYAITGLVQLTPK
jgi:hypothetical protein